MQYKTTDICLATYLSLIGATLDEIQVNGKRGTYIFSNAIQSVIDDFFLGNAKVDPLKYHFEYKKLVSASRHKLVSNSGTS